MIRDFFVRIKGPSLFLSLVFLGMALVVLTLSVRGYKEHSQKKIGDEKVSEKKDSVLSVRELQTMFGTSLEASGKDSSLMVEKNLFSPDREAWQPPPPKEDNDEQDSGRNLRVNSREFKLYGITSSRDEKTALVYYQRLPENSRNRLVSEGETVYQERDGGNEVFRVADIGTDSVTIEANGDTFEVGLFSHEREKVQASGGEGMKVVIGGTSKPSDGSTQQGQSPPESRPESGQQSQSTASNQDRTGQQESENDADSGSDDSEEQSQPGNLPDLLQKMMQRADKGQEQPGQEEGGSNKDMEAQVEEGTMRKIDTPFGPIYRPVD